MEKKNKELDKDALEMLKRVIQPTDVEDDALRAWLYKIANKEMEKEDAMQTLANELNLQDEERREALQALIFEITAKEEAEREKLESMLSELTYKDNEMMAGLSNSVVWSDGNVM